MQIKCLLGELALLLTAMIWGGAFVAQSTGMNSLGPCLFNSFRSFIGAVALLPYILVTEACKRKKTQLPENANGDNWMKILRGGVCCGCFLTAASLLQQWGIAYTTVAKAGFITTFYVILVPLLGWLAKRRPSGVILLCAVMALLGMYLLCSGGEKMQLTLSKGEILVFLCALGFALHIIVIDRFASNLDCVKLAAVQFGVAGILSAVFGLMWGERCTWRDVAHAMLPLLWCGILSSGVGYTLQMVGQKYVQPTVASLLMSMESVFCAAAGWLLLGQKLNFMEIAGCMIIFSSVIIATLCQNTSSL